MTDLLEFVRPSTIAALELCPGRAGMEARACRLVPGLADLTSPIARQGIMAHAIAAQTLSLIYHALDHQGSAAALAKMALALTTLEPWAADACRRCVTYVVALVDRMIAKGLRVVVHVEMHLSGAGFDIRRGGTADVILLGFLNGYLAEVVVEDHKTGFLDQGEAADHLQLHTYAGMAWDKFITYSQSPKLPVVNMEVHLAQGRRREFSAASFTGDDIDNIRDRVVAVVAAAKSANPRITPGIDQCRYCKALPFCRKARSVVSAAACQVDMFGVQPQSREVATLARRFDETAHEVAALWRQRPAIQTTEVDPDLFGDSNDDRAQLHLEAGIARKFLKAIKEAA